MIINQYIEKAEIFEDEIKVFYNLHLSINLKCFTMNVNCMEKNLKKDIIKYIEKSGGVYVGKFL